MKDDKMDVDEERKEQFIAGSVGDNMLELEDFIKQKAKDSKDPLQSLHKISLTYYPFTNKCTMDSSSCTKEECKHLNYLGDDKCLYFEIKRLIYKHFGVADKHHSIENDIQWGFDIYTHKEKISVGFYMNNDSYDILWPTVPSAT